jgi:VanZ family protein
MIKRFRFSVILALIILYLSLKNGNDLNRIMPLNIPHFDKIAHFCMYFGLMSAIILESRKREKANSPIFLMAIFPFSYGILMEILQAVLTTTRTASIFDVIFNALGIFFSILLWQMIRSVYSEKFR